MFNETYLSDNDGNRVSPGVASGDPVLASGISISDATTGADHTETLVAGAIYQIMTTTTGGFILGIADTTDAANIIWFVPAGGSRIFKMPNDKATLHYQGLVNTSAAYIARMK